jgi:hypothetical protein
MNNSNLTAEQCIERLCVLQRLVVETHFGFDRSADCFCGNSGFGAVHARSLSFRNEGHVIEFIEQAVREKLGLTDKPVPSSDPVAWVRAVDGPRDMHPRTAFVDGPYAPKDPGWIPLYIVSNGGRTAYGNRLSWFDQMVRSISRLNMQMEVLMTNQTELATALAAANTKLDTIIVGVGKVKTETQGLKDQVTTLTAELGDVELTPEAQAALDGLNSRIGSLGSAVQDVDDLVPDAPSAATQGGGDSPAPTA